MAVIHTEAPPATPKVSVIIPSFNHAAYLRECVDSVLSQDHPNTEVTVVDDGSSDGSLAILQSYGERIQLIQQRGGRQARARNLGLRVASGELIAFLDSDDRYLPGRLSAAVAAFQAQPEAEVVWGDYRRIDDHGALMAEARWPGSADDFRRVLIASNPICNATVTLRRRVLDEIGGFDERVPRVCDGAAWYQIAARGHRFVHLDRLMLDYRLHRANDSSRFAPMTHDRDTALVSAAQAYVQFGVLRTAADLAWLERAMLRQYSFRAAAWVRRARARGALNGALGGVDSARAVHPVHEWRARLYEKLGSDAGLSMLARLHAFKHRVIGRAR